MTTLEPAPDERSRPARRPDPDPTTARPQVSQLRLVIECTDWDSALGFYRDALGLEQLHGYRNDDGAQLVLGVGSATIELVHPGLPEPADANGGATELSSPPAPRVRLSFQSDDARRTVEQLERAGARRVQDPQVAAEDVISVRLVAPDQMPISIFQPLSGPDFAEAPKPGK